MRFSGVVRLNGEEIDVYWKARHKRDRNYEMRYLAASSRILRTLLAHLSGTDQNPDFDTDFDFGPDFGLELNRI